MVFCFSSKVQHISIEIIIIKRKNIYVTRTTRHYEVLKVAAAAATEYTITMYFNRILAASLFFI